ncbi:MAG: glycosyltransferase [Burkholderiaceae bacterium]|nr:glycosyltransferase [Burkholderiaceae bacterium]
MIPVFNGERFLREALDSLLAQSFTDFELRIADNASTDATAAICLEYAANDSRIIYHRHAKNLGVFGNTEWLYRQAKGEFLILVGDDDVYEPDFLARHVALIRDRKDVILVYSDYGWIDVEGRRSESGLKHFMAPKDGIEKNLTKYIYAPIVLPMGLGLFRTEAVQLALPFPTLGKQYQDFTGGRDIVFLWKILPKGRVDSVRAPLFYYRNKERGYVVPTSWGRNRLMIKLRVIHVNWIILAQHAFPAILAAELTPYQKIRLLIWAGVIFVAQYSLIPVVQGFLRRFRA